MILWYITTVKARSVCGWLCLYSFVQVMLLQADTSSTLIPLDLDPTPQNSCNEPKAIYAAVRGFHFGVNSDFCDIFSVVSLCPQCLYTASIECADGLVGPGPGQDWGRVCLTLTYKRPSKSILC